MNAPVRVLVADADPLARVGLRRVLDRSPGIAAVGEAEDADQATLVAEDLRPEVVVVDARLPATDGFHATRRLVAQGVARAVVLLATTDDPRARRDASEAGARAFVTRADAVAKLGTVVATAVGRTVDSGRGPALAETLTPRELQVLQLIANGLTNDDIAARLDLSVETVRTHVKHVYTKCGAGDRAHAVIAAYENGLVPRP